LSEAPFATDSCRSREDIFICTHMWSTYQEPISLPLS
jgi:hypothetical protein